MAFAPQRGDIVWLSFDPHQGHEQAGRRLAIAVSPKAYNAKVGLALFCPLTTQAKGYPFEVALPSGAKAKGVVLADQVKSLDWRPRGARLFERAPREVIDEVIGKIFTLIED
jgi:mRNA interferase MazF